MIKYVVGNITTNVRQWMFPDGGVGVNINAGEINYEPNDITVKITFGDEVDERGKVMRMNDHIMALAQTMDALRLQFPRSDFALIVGYMPYARQDRICSPGEAHSLRVVSKMINAMDFCVVALIDPHSTVTEALVNGADIITQFDVFKNIKPSFREVYIVATDQGATKKCEDFAKKVGAAGVITCMKHRVDGEVNLRVLDHVPVGANLLVLDDICDGGKTFIEVSKLLRNEWGSIELAVTHGLFTAGFERVGKHFDRVYTTNTVAGDKGDAKVLDII
ncbi:MAG: ribose-phosphate [Caudoviricetes sp.]|nr:MAG: ribose-phosphate [Caudoviricetes sp.]